MSTDPSPHSDKLEDSASANEGSHRLILLGLLIIALSAAGWLGTNWYAVKTELASVKDELQASQLELKDTKQYLDAQRLINARQAQMLKDATEAPVKEASPAP